MAKRQMFINMIQKGRLKPDWDSDGLFGDGDGFQVDATHGEVGKKLNSKRNFENKMSNCLNNKMKVITLHDKWGEFLSE